MLSLAACVTCSVAVSVLLKIARGRSIQVDQAIALNYPVAAVLCLALLRPEPAQVLQPGTPWWILIALGILLPGVFLAMAGAVRHAGIVVSDAAQRLSLLIPLAAAFWVFGESFSGTKLTGMGVALAALLCLIWPTPGTKPATSAGPTTLTRPGGTATLTIPLLLCVWLGYGTIDVLFKEMARSALDFSSSLFAAFVLAGITSFTFLLARRTSWHRRSVAAGTLLGMLNFSNIYFYLLAHQQYPDNPTLVFAAVNVGVIGLGTWTGARLFRETLGPQKIAGLFLAVGAIGLLLPR